MSLLKGIVKTVGGLIISPKNNRTYIVKPAELICPKCKRRTTNGGCEYCSEKLKESGFEEIKDSFRK